MNAEHGTADVRFRADPEATGSDKELPDTLLFVVGQLRTGGLERGLHYLLKELCRRGYRCTVAVWNFSERERYVSAIRGLGVALVGFPPQVPSCLKLLMLRRLCYRLAPCIVHSYSFFTNFAASFACLGTRCRPLGSIRSDFATEKAKNGWLVGSLSARWPKVMIANNHAAKDLVFGDRSCFKPRLVHVVRNGIDLMEFRPVQAWPVTPTVIGIGTLQPDKRWERLLNATAMLRNLAFSVKLVGNGPSREQLAALIDRLGVAGRVELLGERSDIATLLAQSSFLVHTSDREGCPNVIMEAMACGRAVVATDAGDVPELVEEGETGFVVRRGDDASLAERIRTLVLNLGLCEKMGIAGRAKAEREFGLDRLADQTLGVYRSLKGVGASGKNPAR